MIFTKAEILKMHKVEAERRKFLARQELAELHEERQDAIDLGDIEYLKAVCKQIREANMTIILSNKAIKEIDAELEKA